MTKEQRPGDEHQGAEQDRGRSEDEDSTADLFGETPLPYGQDYLDTDLWLDRDGQIHSGDGPYLGQRE